MEVVDVVGGGEDGFLGGDPGSIVEPRLVDGALGTFRDGGEEGERGGWEVEGDGGAAAAATEAGVRVRLRHLHHHHLSLSLSLFLC